MLGYPIRTPSDHSSVDNSPRTIAASHVLHRLLMPRHPPCALQHFTHNKHAQTTKPDTKRCSHPLCNTQHTTTPQPRDNHHHTHPTKGIDALDGPSRERPTREQHPPDSRCLLRTQQRAETRSTTPGVMFHPAAPTPNDADAVSKKGNPATLVTELAYPSREAP